jgi:hypothetical protein
MVIPQISWSTAAALPIDSPNSQWRRAASEMASRPTCAAAAPVACEVCKGWRPRTRCPHHRSARHGSRRGSGNPRVGRYATSVRGGPLPRNRWPICAECAVPASSSSPPQSGHPHGGSTATVSSTCSGGCLCPCRWWFDCALATLSRSDSQRAFAPMTSAMLWRE